VPGVHHHVRLRTLRLCGEVDVRRYTQRRAFYAIAKSRAGGDDRGIYCVDDVACVQLHRGEIRGIPRRQARVNRCSASFSESGREKTHPSRCFAELVHYVA
jgi:hypothetical protein